MDSSLDAALKSACSRLAGSTSARAEAEELLGRLLGLARSRLYLERERVLTPVEWDRLDSWLRRRVRGEPIQYITGRAAFRSLDLAVSSSVLVPRPETEGLVEAVLGVLHAEQARWPRPRILDLGTGSGAIALSLASEWPAASVWASDVSKAALEVARSNAVTLGLEGRVRFVLGDWFGALAPDERLEVIVSNPPYVSTDEWDELPEEVRDWEPEEALFSGTSGLEAQREVVDGAPARLVANGLLALELAEARAAEVAAWLEGAHDWERVELLDDLAGRPRYLLARRRG